MIPILMKTTLIFLFLCLSVYGRQPAAHYYFNHFKVEDGLSQSTVWCILQDKTGFMWFGTKDGLNRFDGYRFKTFQYDPVNPGTSIGNNFIRCLFEDKEGKIWVGTAAGIYIYDPVSELFVPFACKTGDGIRIDDEVNQIQADRYGNIWIGSWQGVFKYNTLSGQLLHFGHDPDNKTSLSSNKIWSLCIDSDNVIWAGSQGSGLNRYQSSTNDFVNYNLGEGEMRGDIYCITEYDSHTLLLGTKDQGVLLLDRISGRIEPFLQDPSEPMFVRSITRIDEQELWIGTEAGIYVYSTDKQTLKKITQNMADPYSLSSNAVYSVYKDREGGIWAGTYFGGVNYLPASYTFEKYYPITGANSLPGKAVREFREDAAGNIWIGTEDAGLAYFNPQTGVFTDFPFRNRLAYHNVHGLWVDGDSLWIGYFSHGMDLVDCRTGRVRHYKGRQEGGELSDNSVFSIYKDRNGNRWFGTIFGLNFQAAGSRKIQQIREVGSEVFIYDILEDSRGVMWFATYNDGVFRYNPRLKKWENFRNDKTNPASLGYDKTIGLYEDSRQRIWICTEGGGLSVYRPDEKKFRTYTVSDGLPNNVVYKVLEDKKGKLWLTTNKGLSCLDPETSKISVYRHKSGLLSDQFNYKSGLCARDGHLYFGSIDGFIRFDPEKIDTSTQASPVVLTGFQIFNRETQVGKDSPLKQSTPFIRKIELGHEQSTFSFDFASLGYRAPETNRYAYKLENFDRDWIYLSRNQRVSYAHIPPGKYVFRVKGSNSDGVWNQAGTAVEIRIRPPFWRSVPGIGLWSVLTAMLGYYFISSYRKKQKIKNARQLEKLEVTKEKEIYKAKIDFFTNIAHEIRTPLSLIMGPYKQIMKNDLSPQDYEENLEIMGSNINRLLHLTDQFLDFRKVENQGFALDFRPVDINVTLRAILYRFKSVFRSKGLEIKAVYPDPPLVTLADSEVLTKIFSNLINNATKFACERLEVELLTNTPAEGFFSFRIRNDGKLIEPENRQHIFETFFQEKTDSIHMGSGLGLPLVKHLVSLHQGKVYVDPAETSCNCFVVELPLTRNIPVPPHETDRPDESGNTADDPVPAAGTEEELPADRPRILVVEDDMEMCLFLKKLLSKHYTFFYANDGKKALHVLEKEPVDLVVSDVIMPGMDGFELCRYLKTRLEYSHIPVVLLTAKTNLNSKIEGLEARADAYIEKPFSVDFLLAQIANILTNKRLQKEAFFKNPLAYTAPGSLTSKADEKFLERITEIILKHLDDETFSIDQLADVLYISRSSLHRKIKHITSFTPNDFIRFIRLKKAAELLESRQYQINEICYIVGFNSPSYFTKCFQKQFGVLPKDFVKGKPS